MVVDCGIVVDGGSEFPGKCQFNTPQSGWSGFVGSSAFQGILSSTGN